MLDIYNNPRVTKSTVYLVTLSTLGEVCAFNAQNREVHKSRRKILALTTTERNIRQYEPTLSEQTNIFLKHILDASQSKDGLIVSEPLGQLGADIISLLAFGYPLNVQTDTTYRFVPESITLGNGINNVKMQFPFLSNSIFSFITDLLTHAQLRRFYKLTDLIVSTRLSSDMDGHADLFSLAADKLKNDKNFKIKDLWAEALFLFSAGTYSRFVFFLLMGFANAHKVARPRLQPYVVCCFTCHGILTLMRNWRRKFVKSSQLVMKFATVPK